jgi:hypothetical protein
LAGRDSLRKHADFALCSDFFGVVFLLASALSISFEAFPFDFSLSAGLHSLPTLGKSQCCSIFPSHTNSSVCLPPIVDLMSPAEDSSRA